MSFEPIAIVGRACVLPGAHDPAALWDAVLGGRDLLSTVPANRWELSRRDIMGTVEAAQDRTWCDRGGYVSDFDLNSEGFAISPSEIKGLDPVFQWLLQAGRDALAEAGLESHASTGAVIGNLSFPTAGMAHHAERVWLGQQLADAAHLPAGDPRNRFMSGLPAHLMAKALGLGRASFCMDAACASSLVAIKLACDRLHRREADSMLAGGVCCADDLFIHVGFCALQAMSRVSASRPFHKDADGLIPAEGAGLVVLERLADAERRGSHILGVIRGIGLSNDGRGKGFLAPAEEGQVRAMEAAYASAGLTPDAIDYVECHATGTTVGDGTEIRSMARVFGEQRELPVGSLKSNLGHLITAAGAAGLLKVLSAMEHETLPPTIHLVDEPLNDDLEGTGLRVVTKPEPWPTDSVRRAGVSAFGFGGNNAHLIVEQYAPSDGDTSVATAASVTDPVVVVGLAVVEPKDGKLTVDPALRFPPRDLEQTLPQQLLMLSCAQAALKQVDQLDTERTGALIGMGCDPSVVRYGARWRTPSWARRWQTQSRTWVGDAQASFTGVLQSAGVLGTMPNIVANRINSAFDLRGPSMTLSAEELSGVRALEVACHALQQHDMDAALVGAVDLSAEPVHEAALSALGIERTSADAAVALVLQRRSDAERLGHTILATIEPTQDSKAEAAHAEGAHAAAGLLAIARRIESCTSGTLHLTALGEQHACVKITAENKPPRADASPGLSFSAHLPAVALPPMPSHEEFTPVKPLNPAEGTMPRAPWLQPTTQPDLTVPPPAPGPAQFAPAQPAAVGLGQAAASTAAASTPGPQPQAPGTTLAWTMAQQQHQAIMQQHQGFLAQQMELHKQFLDMRSRTQQQCLELFSQIPIPTVATPLTAPGLTPAAAPLPAPPAPPIIAPAEIASAIAETAPKPAEPAAQIPIGPTLDRAQLQIHSSGRISEIFGPEFAEQDGYHRQVRMPEPPLLLADRITGLDAEPT
ncbi:MAG: beta-ketoacyl synthase N-terminal-like domain-containing protein [Polyangiaceae bacterium]